MAYMLAHYLNPTARYEGFDILGHLIEWAQGSITSRMPNFHFQKVDIYSKWYNPHGALKSSEFRFPYDDESFDFVFLTSVFTHMLADDVRHYLDEFHRVLRPGGHCLTTCFLLNEESEELIRRGKSHHNLVHPLDECYTSNPEIPEDAIGYKEPLLLSWIAERGFTHVGKHYGLWCGRNQFTSFQDILVYKK
jgi:SAM-dependent methyltransferase